jgi:hypothetical protein
MKITGRRAGFRLSCLQARTTMTAGFRRKRLPVERPDNKEY